MKAKSLFLSIGIFSLLLLILNLGSIFALTGSIGNARMILYPEVGFFGATIEKSILVKNTNDVPVNVTLEEVDDIVGIANIIDKNFILEAGEEKNAVFELKIKKPGNYTGKINVYFREIEPGKPGVVLSSTIIIFAKKDSFLDGDNSGISGNIVLFGNNTAFLSNIKESPVIIALFSSTIILVVVLILLFILIKKREKKEIKIKKKRSATKA